MRSFFFLRRPLWLNSLIGGLFFSIRSQSAPHAPHLQTDHGFLLTVLLQHLLPQHLRLSPCSKCDCRLLYTVVDVQSVFICKKVKVGQSWATVNNNRSFRIGVVTELVQICTDRCRSVLTYVDRRRSTALSVLHMPTNCRHVATDPRRIITNRCRMATNGCKLLRDGKRNPKPMAVVVLSIQRFGGDLRVAGAGR